MDEGNLAGSYHLTFEIETRASDVGKSHRRLEVSSLNQTAARVCLTSLGCASLEESIHLAGAFLD